MRFFAIVALILALVVAAGATDRAAMPVNPNACKPPAEPHHGPQNGDGFVITTQRAATVYYNLAEFLAVLEADYYFDDFAWLDWATISNVVSYQFGPVNGYSYTAFAANELFSIPGAMSTSAAEDPIILTFDGLPVTAVAGDFFGTDFDGISCGDGLWATYDNFYVGQMAFVPVEDRSWGRIKTLYR